MNVFSTKSEGFSALNSSLYRLLSKALHTIFAISLLSRVQYARCLVCIGEKDAMLNTVFRELLYFI